MTRRFVDSARDTVPGRNNNFLKSDEIGPRGRGWKTAHRRRLAPFIGCLRAVSMRDTLSLNNAREPPRHGLTAVPSETCGRPTTCPPSVGQPKLRRELGAWRGQSLWDSIEAIGTKHRWPNSFPPLLPSFLDRKEHRKGIRRARRKNCGGSYLHRPAINLIYSFSTWLYGRKREFRSAKECLNNIFPWIRREIRWNLRNCKNSRER